MELRYRNTVTQTTPFCLNYLNSVHHNAYNYAEFVRYIGNFKMKIYWYCPSFKTAID